MSFKVAAPFQRFRHRPQASAGGDMRPTRVELFAGFLLTLVVYLGLIVSGLFLLWTLHRWATQEEVQHSRPTRTEFVSVAGQPAEGEFAIPSPDEYQVLLEPSLETTVSAVADAVNETAVSLDALRGNRPSP